MNEKHTVSVGFFDGVHVGHAALLEMTKRRALETASIPTVLSFDVHPDTLVLGKSVPLIISAEGREEKIRRCFGIENTVFIRFNYSLMSMHWREFADLLVSEMNVSHIVVGNDFTFGSRGEGNAQKLLEYCNAFSVGCDIIPPVIIDNRVVSSTYIRTLLESGRIEEANRHLGFPHSLIDNVRSGYRLGQKIGSPTINMAFQAGVLVPAHGVYATRVYLDTGESYDAVTNIGVRPTVRKNDAVGVETHLLDFQGNLYNRTIRLDFHSFIRPEREFASVEELSAQISTDIDRARMFFKKNK